MAGSTCEHKKPVDNLGFSVRKVTDLIVVHCSATKEGVNIGLEEINDWHKRRGWGNDTLSCGYHEIIRIDGTVESGRPLHTVGAHSRGHNYRSIGICLVGGLDSSGEPSNTFNSTQLCVLKSRIDFYRSKFPSITEVVGHRDLSKDLDGDGIIESHEWVKACPCFNVSEVMPQLTTCE